MVVVVAPFLVSSRCPSSSASSAFAFTGASFASAFNDDVDEDAPFFLLLLISEDEGVVEDDEEEAFVFSFD